MVSFYDSSFPPGKTRIAVRIYKVPLYIYSREILRGRDACGDAVVVLCHKSLYRPSLMRVFPATIISGLLFQRPNTSKYIRASTTSGVFSLSKEREREWSEHSWVEIYIYIYRYIVTPLGKTRADGEFSRGLGLLFLRVPRRVPCEFIRRGENFLFFLFLSFLVYYSSNGIYI